MKSGMVAAESVFESLKVGPRWFAVCPCTTDWPRVSHTALLHACGLAFAVLPDVWNGCMKYCDASQNDYEQSGTEVTEYQSNMEKSWVWDELKSVRNYHPSFKFGLLGGVLYVLFAVVLFCFVLLFVAGAVRAACFVMLHVACVSHSAIVGAV